MSIYYEEGRHTKPSYRFTENLLKGGFHGFKDLDVVLHEIAEKTGYDYNYLNDVFCESDEDYIERIIFISDCAIEQDL